MSLRKWSKGHTFGMLLGILTPLVVIPLLILFLSWVQNYDFSHLWREFNISDQYRVRMITLSIIANLFWFYYFLNRSKWDYGMGVILGSVVYAPYIIYIKFF